jgi:carboxyl-terminal processing protease
MTAGYIINRFAETTRSLKGFVKLKQGAKVLVIDLAIMAAIWKRQLLLLMNLKTAINVFTKNKKKENTKTYATKKGGFETGKYLCYRMKIVQE